MFQHPERFRVNGNGSGYEGELPEELRSFFASPPPVYRPPVMPTPTRSSSTPGWVLGLFGIVAGVILGITLSTRHQESPIPQSGQTMAPVTNPDTPRSLRALPVYPPTPQREIGAQQMLEMPDGSRVWTTFKGNLHDVSELPPHGSQIGDMYGIGGNLWILTTIPNSNRVGWVDPPDNQSRAPEVRRAILHAKLVKLSGQ